MLLAGPGVKAPQKDLLGSQEGEDCRRLDRHHDAKSISDNFDESTNCSHTEILIILCMVLKFHKLTCVFQVAYIGAWHPAV